MDVDGQPSGPHRVEDLWFEDGNIVIQAGNAQYRVFRSVLARHSSVFQDMLSFPQPQDAELVDGCSLVRLPDSEVEVTPFLKALFDPEFFLPFPACTTFEAVYGCLRLSHKYAVEFLCRRALVHFSSQFRPTLSEFDNGDYPEEVTSTKRVPAHAASWPAPNDFDEFLVCCVQLAREVDTPWTLPNIFYLLGCRYNIWGMRLSEVLVWNGIECTLSRQDQEVVFKGSELQMKASWDVLGCFESPPDDCESKVNCSLVIFAAVSASRNNFREFQRFPLHVWTNGHWGLLGDACEGCLGALKERHRTARERFWDALPELYGLPPWTDLEAKRRAAIGDDLLV
ncbi:hypothetical protein C8F01DRAFT_1057450 [Mycena amicta]|nr:hypothetical protein C8F01DRAFT_1057450 [Mycena amicta]